MLFYFCNCLPIWSCAEVGLALSSHHPFSAPPRQASQKVRYRWPGELLRPDSPNCLIENVLSLPDAAAEQILALS